MDFSIYMKTYCSIQIFCVIAKRSIVSRVCFVVTILKFFCRSLSGITVIRDVSFYDTDYITVLLVESEGDDPSPVQVLAQVDISSLAEFPFYECGRFFKQDMYVVDLFYILLLNFCACIDAYAYVLPSMSLLVIFQRGCGRCSILIT